VGNLKAVLLPKESIEAYALCWPLLFIKIIDVNERDKSFVLNKVLQLNGKEI